MDIAIRPINKDEHKNAWRVLRELRSALSYEQFEASLAVQSREHRYELFGAYSDETLLGVMGLRPVHTFARGAHLHVDDLVVAHDARGRGIGTRLIEFARNRAAAQGMKHVFLDSRPNALPFYEHHGYQRHDSVLVREDL